MTFAEGWTWDAKKTVAYVIWCLGWGWLIGILTQYMSFARMLDGETVWRYV